MRTVSKERDMPLEAHGGRSLARPAVWVMQISLMMARMAHWTCPTIRNEHQGRPVDPRDKKHIPSSIECNSDTVAQSRPLRANT